MLNFEPIKIQHFFIHKITNGTFKVNRNNYQLR